MSWIGLHEGDDDDGRAIEPPFNSYVERAAEIIKSRSTILTAKTAMWIAQGLAEAGLLPLRECPRCGARDPIDDARCSSCGATGWPERLAHYDQVPGVVMEPPFNSPCECCDRSVPTAMYVDAGDNAVALCAECVAMLTEAESG